MKKHNLFFLAFIMSFCFCGLCGCQFSNSSNTSNTIYLTKENASQYLTISAKSYGNYNSELYGYQTTTSTISIAGASSHYIFHNVAITITITGTMVGEGFYGETAIYEHELVCKLNLGGNGNVTDTQYNTLLTNFKINVAKSVTAKGYIISNITGYVEFV